MCIIEQVEKLMKDMETLSKDLENTDVENIDKEQLKKLRKYCSGFSCEIAEQIERINESEE